MHFTRDDTNVAKGLAIVLMLWHHLFSANALNAEKVFSLLLCSREQLERSAAVGKVCVSMFVLLSGYGISAQLDKLERERGGGELSLRETEGYALRRWFSLMSGFWFIYVLTLLAALCSGRMWTAGYLDEGIKRGVVYALTDMAGLANLFGTPTLNATWWYMSLAVVLCFLLPLLHRLCKRTGPLLLLPVVAWLSLGLLAEGRNDNYIYLTAAILGIFCAQGDWLARWKAWGGGRSALHTVAKAAALAALAFALMKLRLLGSSWRYAAMPLLALCLIALSYTLSPAAPAGGGYAVFRFLGKHSMNIFLTHTLIFRHYCEDFIYGFRYPAAILLALLAASVLLSLLIEWLKKVTRYNAAMARIGDRLTRKRSGA